MLYLTGTVAGIVVVAVVALAPFFALVLLSEALLARAPLGRPGRFLLLVFRSLRRNRLRTSLTYLATFVLVMVVTLVWSVLYYLDGLVVEKSRDLKIIVSDRWQALSQMPYAYAEPISRAAADPRRRGDVLPQDSMTWQYYIGTTDPAKQTRESTVFFIALDPSKVLTMLDRVFQEFAADPRQQGTPEELARLTEAARALGANRRGAILGRNRLKDLNKRVGDCFSVTGMNYSKLGLEFEILGVFPGGRYDDVAVMNRDYLNEALAAYPKAHAGQKHPLADKSLNVVWLQVADQPEFQRVAAQVEGSALFRDPAVRCQTLSSGIATRLESFTDMVWAMRWLLSPAIVITMALVISSAVSLSVRERRSEMAVLKVLGFRPAQVLGLVLGEGLLVGALAGLLSGLVSYVAVDEVLPRLGVFPVYVPVAALLWAPSLGAICALAGSAAPAYSATGVKVAEVFSRVS